VRSCTVISRRHPIVKQKKVIVRSGPLSVEVLFLGRDIGQLGQGCPSHPDPHVYRGPCKKNKLRPRFFSQLVSSGVRSCTVISRRHPIVKQKRQLCGLAHSRSKFGFAAESSVTGGYPPDAPNAVSPPSLEPHLHTSFHAATDMSWLSTVFISPEPRNESACPGATTGRRPLPARGSRLPVSWTDHPTDR
jgi:hypothetical protein